MKHTLKAIMMSALLFGSIAACGNANTNTPTNQTSIETGQISAPEQVKEKMDELKFYEFDLEVSYANDKEYEADLDWEDGRLEAKIEDDLKNVKLYGDEAFEEMYPRLKQLNLSSNSTNEEAIAQVLKAFDLPDNYVKFELEIDFIDNSKLEVEQRK